MKKRLLDYSIEELKTELADMGESAFRAGQIMKWLTLGVPFADMTNLSKELREKLAETYTEGYAKTLEVLESADGTKKFLFEMQDDATVESVFMQKDYGNTVCVSTQVGCRMGCTFCASGADGLRRNLSAGEILSQVVAVNALRKVNNIVLMGMGEPLDNYDNVVKFIRLVNAKEGLNIGQRGISLSTCGIVDKIYALADEGLSVTLSISLHAATDEKRQEIMPTARKYKIGDILAAAHAYFQKTGRRVIIEYVVLGGFNDTPADAAALKLLLQGESRRSRERRPSGGGGMNCHINLIPVNGREGERQKNAYVFLGLLEKEGLSATVRKSMGGDIEGACGQLRQRHLKD